MLKNMMLPHVFSTMQMMGRYDVMKQYDPKTLIVLLLTKYIVQALKVINVSTILNHSFY